MGSARCLAWSLAAALTTPAQADPLLTRNENPLLAPFGIPSVLPSRLPAAGSGVISATFSWSNSMTIEDEGGRQFTMDGEGQELRLEVVHAFTDKLAARAELPWRHLSGGSLDDLVENWHEFWGLPHGDRDEAPHDRLLIQYGENETDMLRVDESASGVADIPVSLGYQVSDADEYALATWLTFKIPVGNAEDLSGSEAFDVALSVAGQAQLAAHWQVFGQADVTWLGAGEVLPALQQDYVWSAMAGITWNAWRGLDLTAQLDANSEVFDAPATNVTGDAVVLNVGGSYRTAGGWRFDLSVGEDLTVDAAPDFTVALAARRGY
jgi:Protein of unknown function (DUF3187)